MAEYRYYLIPDFMSHVFPQQFEEQAPTEFFSNTADLMKRYKQLREILPFIIRIPCSLTGCALCGKASLYDLYY